MNEGSDMGGAGAAGVRRESNGKEDEGNRNGSNLSTVLGIIELCWGDVGLLLSMPRQGLGNSAIASVATEEQLEKYGGKWAAMAITEPEAGSDSAAIRTTADLSGDEYVLNGEKIFVTSGDRADLIVVWATLDRPRDGRRSSRFIVERDNPGLKLDRLEHKLGIRASDTANFTPQDCRVPKEALLGDPESTSSRASAGRCRPSTTRGRWSRRWRSASPAPRLKRRKELEPRPGSRSTSTRPGPRASRAAHELLALEAELEAARWLALRAAWLADRGMPNSLEASMAKAKAGRIATELTLRCVELCGAAGYAEGELLEKWARDAKILDIFEGTQQIQLLIVARRVLGKSSGELR
jgi:acyl-CoA dehydrogenase